MRRSPWFVLPVLAILVLAISAPAAEPSADARAKRRTPVVEVFDDWNQSVVFVTGPMVKANRAPLEEFFLPPPTSPQERSVGTGFVLHESGYIVANAHGAENIISPEIALADGKLYPAELIAVAHDKDLAVLKIDAGRPLKPVRLAAAGDVMIGEQIVVIGNPHGLLRTCTTGVVSAHGRATHLADVPGVTLVDMLQTDAGINPGSSGGPWFNILGDVIGVTASRKNDAENISFAISVGSLRKALPVMLDVERRQGFSLGLSLPLDGPCRVGSVGSDSPASVAGLQAGDTIVRLDGKATPTVLDYWLALIDRRAGETLLVDYVRQDKPGQTAVVPSPRPKPDGAALLRQRLGLATVPLDAATAKTMNLRVRRGARITEVDPKLYASLDFKPEPGDVLARIGPYRPRDLDHIGLLLDDVQPGQKISCVLCRKRGNDLTRINMNIVIPK